MEKVLGLLLGLVGLFTLATSFTPDRNPKSNDREANIVSASEGIVAPECVMPLKRLPKKFVAHSAIPISDSYRASPPAIERDSGEDAKELSSAPAWLAELNQWRRMAGLGAVAENAHLSYGSEEHARYLVVQGPTDSMRFRVYDRRIGPGAHREDSRSPFYNAAGAQAAIGGPLAADVIQGADVAWEGRTESGDIDNLIIAPFHRLSLLAPWAQVGGYGSFGVYPRRAAALALRGPLEAQQWRQAIEFPPANANISFSALSGSEWPNPLGSCAGYKHPVGLPITLQIGRRLLLQDYSFRDETLNRTLDACGFDAASYRNPDSTQQRRGRELLNAYGAAVIIPRSPLSPGHEYHVMLETSAGRFGWAFRLSFAPLLIGESSATRRTETAQARHILIGQMTATR